MPTILMEQKSKLFWTSGGGGGGWGMMLYLSSAPLIILKHINLWIYEDSFQQFYIGLLFQNLQKLKKYCTDDTKL